MRGYFQACGNPQVAKFCSTIEQFCTDTSLTMRAGSKVKAIGID
jgi:hypothetical protein